MAFSGILAMPIFHNTESKIFYADVLREYTFWNKNILNYFVKICEIFEKLIHGERCKNVLIEIYRKYAIAVFNMIWWCNQETHSKEANDCIRLLLNKKNEICNSDVTSDVTICQACFAINMVLKNRKN